MNNVDIANKVFAAKNFVALYIPILASMLLRLKIQFELAVLNTQHTDRYTKALKIAWNVFYKIFRWFRVIR